MRVFRMLLFGLLALFNAVKFILIGGSVWNLFQALICLVIVAGQWALLRKKKKAELRALSLLGTLFAALIVAYCSMFEFGFGDPGFYDLKVQYAAKRGYTTEHFPQTIPEGAKLLNCRMMPTIMQGSGNVEATFEVTEALEQKMEEAAQKACVMSFSGADYKAGSFSGEDRNRAQKIFESLTGFKDVEAEILVCDPTGLIRECADTHDITIYILYSNFYWNHCHTDSVVIDHTGHQVQFVGQ